MLKRLPFALCACLIAVLAKPASATEGGTQHYPIGVNTIADGNLPVPGMLQMLTYSEVALNPVLTDGSGNKAVAKFNLANPQRVEQLAHGVNPVLGEISSNQSILAAEAQRHPVQKNLEPQMSTDNHK